MISICWDLDGTLVDSMPVIVRCLNKTITHYGKTAWLDADIRPLIGPELSEILATMLNTQNEVLKAEAKKIYREFYKVEMFNSPVFPDIEPALKHFQNIGAQQFVATAKYELYAQQIIEHSGLSSYFDGIYGTTESGRYGDKKELLERLIVEERIKPADCLMIGDTRYDIAAGRHNNMTAIGVLWGYGEEAILKKEGAHFCASAADELPSIVKSAVASAC